MPIALLITSAVLLAVAVTVFVWRVCQRQARRAGYASVGDYLQAVPRSEAEKRDAVELGLKGLVMCILGLLVPPLLFIGVFPFYYGARKIALSSLGFGLFEDADEPSV